MKTHPNSLDNLTENFKEGLGDLLTDDTALNTSFEEVKGKLKIKYPHFSDYMLNYWSARITIFNYGQGEDFMIKGINTEAPYKITLTVYSDTSS